MNYLINFLFSNLIPIIIVVSVVLRIYGGIKNAAASRRGTAPSMPVQEAEERDEDETGNAERDRGDDIPPRFYLAESKPPRQAAPPPLPSLVSLPGLGSLDSVPPGLTPRLGSQTAGGLPAEPRQVPAPAFFRRIKALRPMQQALVLSEILGSPRGMNP
ncbi:MAG: hypothetical protein LBT87_09960 [Treponema sp.]|jgi:hypothetical protein|nr:hypothetical protein [Treponema sp.]